MARQLGLSVSACWRRIRRLERLGVIIKRVALLDPHKINVGMSVFVAVEIEDHDLNWITKFCGDVSNMPEVVEFYRMSGEVDYLLRVVVRDMQAYDKFYRKLIGQVEIKNVKSSFAMNKIKFTTQLPLAEVS